MNYADFKTVRNNALLIVSILGIVGIIVGLTQDNWLIVGESTGFVVGIVSLLSYLQFSVFSDEFSKEIRKKQKLFQLQIEQSKTQEK